jgi:alpha-glucosidase
MKNNFFLLLFLVIGITACNRHIKKIVRVSSPDGKIEVTFDNSNSKLIYSVKYLGKEIISKSKMGFEFRNQHSLENAIQIVEYKTTSFDQNWEQPWGEQRVIRENYNELLLDLAEKKGKKRKLQIVFRVFNDGIGFRCIFPEQENLEYFEIMDEKTEFNFPSENKAWWIKAYQPDRYEYLYQLSAINDIDSVNGAHTPLTIVTVDNLYLSIHEADLTDYASMCLNPSGNNGLKCALTPWSDGIKVKAEAPHQTPWRTIQIAEKPGDLITSGLILNLNPPNKLGDVSWLKPVKYVGIWWGMHIGKWTFTEGENHGATTERAKQYIDFAAKHGFDEVLVEGWNKGWKTEWWLDDGSDINFVESTPDYDLVEVQNYAKSKGVSLQIYNETMSNIRNYLSQIDSAYKLFTSLGIKTAKIGQVGSKLDQKEWHYSQYGVNYYRKVLKKAAEHKIAVNFHEPVKATGERRTYPNMFSREGARGMEYNAWSSDGGNPPSYTCILPFTRMLAGPMDYTPGIFDITIPGRENNQVNTTLAKQLALYVVIYSPVQMAADLIENYEDHPAFQFIKDVPVDWETTEVIDAKIGEFLIIARKDKYSEDWYLGAITNEKARDFNIILDFFETDKLYTAQIYKDSEESDYKTNPTAYRIEEKQVKKGEVFNIKLENGGGMAVRFKSTE